MPITICWESHGNQLGPDPSNQISTDGLRRVKRTSTCDQILTWRISQFLITPTIHCTNLYMVAVNIFISLSHFSGTIMVSPGLVLKYRIWVTQLQFLYDIAYISYRLHIHVIILVFLPIIVSLHLVEYFTLKCTNWGYGMNPKTFIGKLSLFPFMSLCHSKISAFETILKVSHIK